MRRLLVLLSIAIALVVASPAFAQGQPRTQKQKIEEATPHFQKGVELYDENDFSGALIEFKRAYEIAQDYHVLFNVSQTYYQMQNYAGALDAFQRYLNEGGANVARDRRQYVEKEIQKLKGRVALVRIAVNVAGADITVDDEKVGTSPLDHPVTVSQGKRKIMATLAGKPPATSMIEVAGGDSPSISLQIDTSGSSTTNNPPPPPPPPVETRRRVPWIAWGIAGGLFAVWGATGVTALVFSSTAQSRLNTYGSSADDIKSAQNTAGAFALVSDISLGCTIVAVGVATVMTLLAKPEPVEKRVRLARHQRALHRVAHGSGSRRDVLNFFRGPSQPCSPSCSAVLGGRCVHSTRFRLRAALRATAARG